MSWKATLKQRRNPLILKGQEYCPWIWGGSRPAPVPDLELCGFLRDLRPAPNGLLRPGKVTHG
jgi:hypothetical protein